MGNNRPLISIIVPSYNVESIYRECVDSILTQTYDNIEVILVNDGSMDDTGRIADEYEKADSRVKVIHKENGGASTARNRGLDIATGDFIGFVDSDDWIEPDMYERLIEPFLSGELDQTSFTVLTSRVHNIDGSHIDYCSTDSIIVIDGNALWDDFFDITGKGLIQQSLCNKLFPSNLIKGCRFKEGVIGEDIEIQYKILDKTRKCMILPYVGYHARQVATSVTHRSLREINFSIAEITNEKINFVKEYHPDKLAAAYAFDLKQQTNIWQRMVYAENAKDFRYKRKEIKRRIAVDLKMTRTNNKAIFKERVIGYLILFNLFKPARFILGRG